MRRIAVLLMFFSFLFSWPVISYGKNTYRPKTAHTYITGKRGGCYYINRNGNKTYVDRDLCK